MLSNTSSFVVLFVISSKKEREEFIEDRGLDRELIKKLELPKPTLDEIKKGREIKKEREDKSKRRGE